MRLQKYFTAILMAIFLFTGSISMTAFGQEKPKVDTNTVDDGNKGVITQPKPVNKQTTRRVKRCTWVNVSKRKTVRKKRKCICTNVNTKVSEENKAKALELDGREKAIVERATAVTAAEDKLKTDQDALAIAQTAVNNQKAANDKRSGELDKRETDVAAREAAVSNTDMWFWAFLALLFLGLPFMFWLGSRIGRRSGTTTDTTNTTGIPKTINPTTQGTHAAGQQNKTAVPQTNDEVVLEPAAGQKDAGKTAAPTAKDQGNTKKTSS